ncbi:2-hydroxyacyl-CoA dehydratase [bacterium]|nr:2-hydroxyacyl-CoA dehydratase [bacterium]
MKKRIGITTTIPQEVIWASGNIPVDLNNLFLADDKREQFLSLAYREGYPRTICAWIAGIYGAVAMSEDIDTIVFLSQGDCSNTHALAETLEDIGIKVIPFAFPYDGNKRILDAEITNLGCYFGVEREQIIENFRILEKPRRLAQDIDRLAWEENKITSFENHLFHVTTSDFNSDIEKYCATAEKLIEDAKKRTSFDDRVRLGYIGVPPIFPEIFDFFDSLKARVVFVEVQRQFSLPFEGADLLEAYCRYTYPTSVFRRIKDIKEAVQTRSIDGIIHYTQSFCFRQIEDLLFRKHIDVPFLTIEGESQFDLDERTRVRAEAFIKLLEDKK